MREKKKQWVVVYNSPTRERRADLTLYSSHKAAVAWAAELNAASEQQGFEGFYTVHTRQYCDRFNLTF